MGTAVAGSFVDYFVRAGGIPHAKACQPASFVPISKALPTICYSSSTPASFALSLYPFKQTAIVCMNVCRIEYFQAVRVWLIDAQGKAVGSENHACPVSDTSNLHYIRADGFVSHQQCIRCLPSTRDDTAERSMRLFTNPSTGDRRMHWCADINGDAPTRVRVS